MLKLIVRKVHRTEQLLWAHERLLGTNEKRRRSMPKSGKISRLGFGFQSQRNAFLGLYKRTKRKQLNTQTILKFVVFDWRLFGGVSPSDHRFHPDRIVFVWTIHSIVMWMSYYLSGYRRENHRSSRVWSSMNFERNSCDTFDDDRLDRLVSLREFDPGSKNFLSHIRSLSERDEQNSDLNLNYVEWNSK